jgi:hypothetical protein
MCIPHPLPPVCLDALRSLQILFAPNAAAENVYVCDTKLLPPCTEPYVRRFQYVLAVITPARFYMEPYVSLMKINQAQTVAMVTENTTFALALRDGTVTSATNNRMRVVSDIVLPVLAHSATSKAADDALLLEALRATADLDPGTQHTARQGRAEPSRELRWGWKGISADAGIERRVGFG